MMAWFYLVIAGLFEICWPTGFKVSLTSEHKFLWILFSVVGMGLSGVFLYLAQKTIPIGAAYAVWVGVGALGTFLIGLYFFGETANIFSYLGIGFILGGVMLLKLSVLH